MSNNIYDILKKMQNLESPKQSLTEGKKAKPDYIDIDKDGDKKEPMKKAAREKSKGAVAEAVAHVEQQLAEKYQGFKKSISKGDMNESALQAHIGMKKYGPEGMEALQQAGREGASKEKMAKIRAQHDKMDEAVDQEGPADLLAAVEQEIARPGRSTDNLRDVLNATFGSDRSPEFKKARAVIGKYLDLVDNADVGSEQDGIALMRGGNIARHIQQYDLTDYLQHAAAMLDKAVNGPMYNKMDEGENIDEVVRVDAVGYGSNILHKDEYAPVNQQHRDKLAKQVKDVRKFKREHPNWNPNNPYGNIQDTFNLGPKIKTGTRGSKSGNAPTKDSGWSGREGVRTTNRPAQGIMGTGIGAAAPAGRGKGIDEGSYNEDMLSPSQKKFAALAEPKDKITYADKIAGAKKKQKDEGNEFSGNRQDAIDAGQDKFKVDGKTYPVKEDDFDAKGYRQLSPTEADKVYKHPSYNPNLSANAQYDTHFDEKGHQRVSHDQSVQISKHPNYNPNLSANAQRNLLSKNEGRTSMREGWEEMQKYLEKKRGPESKGGAGKKAGTRYGGSAQRDDDEETDGEGQAVVKKKGRPKGTGGGAKFNFKKPKD